MPAGAGFKPDEVKRAIHGSLRRLGLDYVDLYQLHWPAQRIPVEDTWGAMAEIQDEGLARHIGVSNFDRPLLDRCLAIRHVDSVQNELSLINQDDRADFLPLLGFLYFVEGQLRKRNRCQNCSLETYLTRRRTRSFRNGWKVRAFT